MNVSKRFPAAPIPFWQPQKGGHFHWHLASPWGLGGAP